MVQNAHLDCLTRHTTASIHSCSTPAGKNLSWAEDSSRLRATRPALESLREPGLLTSQAFSRPAGRWNQQLLPHPPDNSAQLVFHPQPSQGQHPSQSLVIWAKLNRQSQAPVTL